MKLKGLFVVTLVLLISIASLANDSGADLRDHSYLQNFLQKYERSKGHPQYPSPPATLPEEHPVNDIYKTLFDAHEESFDYDQTVVSFRDEFRENFGAIAHIKEARVVDVLGHEENIPTDATKKKYPLVNRFFPFSFNTTFWENNNIVQDWYFQNHTNIIRLKRDEILQRSLVKHWDVIRGQYNVVDARAGIASSVGRLLPQLKLTIPLNTATYMPLDITHLLVGFFNFLLPQRWFELMAALGQAKAANYAYTDMLLDRFLVTELNFLNIHKLKWDFSIMTLYMNYTLNVLHSYEGKEKSDPDLIRVLEELMFRLVDASLNISQKLRVDLIPALIADMGGPTEKEKRSGAMIDVERLSFPQLQDRREIDVSAYSLDEFYKRSPKLWTQHYLANAGFAKVGSVATNGFLITEPAGVAGITLGFDLPVNTLVSYNQIRKIRQFEKQYKTQIGNSLKAIVENHNLTLLRYHYELSFLEKRKAVLQSILHKQLDTHQLTVLFYYGAYELMVGYLNLNTAYHNYLMADAMMRRLKVIPDLQYIQDVLKIRDPLLNQVATSLRVKARKEFKER